MNRFVLLFAILFSALVCTAQIQHPAAWLRADSTALGASSWHDVSGNGFDAVPSAGSMPAAFSRMNFNKCFEVSGAETFTLPLGINDSKHADVIVVYETLDTVGENALWQIQLDTATRIGQTTRRILNDNGQITYDTANRLRPVVNYLAQSWRTPEVCAPVLALCAADSLALNGHIAEALYFGHRISDTAVIQWISYLAVKYGVTLLQTDYLDSRRNVIWDYTGYPDYCTSIAGLGRDDSTGLSQKQTYFAGGQTVFGMDQLASTNEGNPAVINDGDFILLGCRDSLHTVSTIYTQDGTTYEVFGRSMAQVTGNASIYGTFILLDTSAVRDSVLPVLLIDRSGTGEFPAGEMEQVPCSGTDTAGRCLYNNIHWDTDLNGRDFFCFAVAVQDTNTPKALAANDSGNAGMAQDNTSLAGRGDISAEPKSQQPPIPDSRTQTARYRLLPNPNHGHFVVEAEYPEAQDVTVTVYDADGKLLLTMTGKGQCNHRFEGTLQAAGHYLIDIASESERKTLKMVVN